MEAKPIKIFVSYSHQDSKYLEKASLMGYLQGLEIDGAEFWDDRKLRVGDLWDDVIKAQLSSSHIALVLVSQAFLDSEYCQNTEIQHLLASQSHLFPIILSACEWRRHDWLRSRQFLPRGDKTLEENYRDAGSRKKFYLEVRQSLRERMEEVASGLRHNVHNEDGRNLHHKGSPQKLTGAMKLEFSNRLGPDWRKLAVVLNIPNHDYVTFSKGSEGLDILDLLDRCNRLHELNESIEAIGRSDLLSIFALDVRRP